MKKQLAALGVVAALLLTGCSTTDTSELDSLRSQIATLTSQRDDARAALRPQDDITEREVAADGREQSLDKWEDDLNDFRDELADIGEELKSREAAVEKREKAIEKAEGREEDWIKDVRQCLARDGDYKSASITWTDFSGTDFSCYTG